MIIFRELLAVMSFSIAIMLLVTLFADGFETWLLVGVVAFFVAAYWIWPSKKRGQRRDDYLFLDLVEFFIELPVTIVLKLLRLFGGGDGAGFD